MVETSRITQLMQQLIFYKQNDLLADIDSGYVDEKAENHFTELILGVTRYLHDFRYCSKADCPCSPETQIKRGYEPIKEMLQTSSRALSPVPYKVIEDILEEIK